MKQKAYKNVDEFEEDIKRFGDTCCTIFPHKREIKKASKDLIGYVKEQIQLKKACDECFKNAYELGKSSVIKPCSKPHLLLWAKVKGFGYWPAKVMTVDAQEKTVHVRFFGDYSKSVLQATNCFLYSKNNPGQNDAGQQKSLYTKALEVSSN